MCVQPTARWLIEPLSVTSPVSIGRRGHQQRPRDVVGASGGAVRQGGEALGKSSPHGRVRERRCGVGSRRQAALAGAGLEIGEDQGADEVAVEAGQDRHVADQRSAGTDHRRAHGGEIDPGAGRELEVFADAAIEDETLGYIRRIDPADGVADLVEAFLVERLGGLVRVSARIARRHVRTLEAQLQLVLVRDELDLPFREPEGRCVRPLRRATSW